MKYQLIRIMYGFCYMVCLLFAWGIWGENTCEPIHVQTKIEETNGKVKKSPVEAPKIALTFDDGPNPSSTPLLLEGLKERGIQATFFVIGECAQQYPEIVKREAEEGHIIGNHTYHHVEITKVSAEQAKKEIVDTSDLVKKITGQPTVFMRPPFGAWQKNLELEMEAIPVFWSIDPLDWTTENEDEIVNKVVTEAGENDIILLHDCYPSSVRAALRIADILTKQGFQFVTVDELLLN